MDSFVGNHSKISLPPNEGLHLDVTVEKLTLQGLIDTGSSFSIIHTKKFDLLPSEIRENVLPTKCVLRMVDGGPVGYKGTTILPLCIGSKTYYQQVPVAETEASFELGYDFLYDKQCSLDISKGNYSSKTSQSNANLRVKYQIFSKLY